MGSRSYHRVEIRQANYQHARELLQSQLQHMETIDLEKRVAIRENMRDEWGQITDSAETVLIVNTLMLGVGCAMLIEGDLPEFIATVHPWVPVFYYALLSFSIWQLVLSVRFAMVLSVSFDISLPKYWATVNASAISMFSKHLIVSVLTKTTCT